MPPGGQPLELLGLPLPADGRRLSVMSHVGWERSRLTAVMVAGRRGCIGSKRVFNLRLASSQRRPRCSFAPGGAEAVGICGLLVVSRVTWPSAIGAALLEADAGEGMAVALSLMARAVAFVRALIRIFRRSFWADAAQR